MSMSIRPVWSGRWRGQPAAEQRSRRKPGWRRRWRTNLHILIARECPAEHSADCALAYSSLATQYEDLALYLAEPVLDCCQVRVRSLWCGLAGVLVRAALAPGSEAGFGRVGTLWSTRV